MGNMHAYTQKSGRRRGVSRGTTRPSKVWESQKISGQESPEKREPHTKSFLVGLPIQTTQGENAKTGFNYGGAKGTKNGEKQSARENEKGSWMKKEHWFRERASKPAAPQWGDGCVNLESFWGGTPE